MNSRIGKSVIIVSVLALLSIAAYWYWSPFLAMRSMHAAAQSNDAEAFNAHVDYPRLRESLKGQFSAMMAEKIAKSGDAQSPSGTIGAMLGAVMVDKVIDAMVRPDTVMRGMKSGQFVPAPMSPEATQSGGEGTAVKAGSDAEKQGWTYERKGANLLIAYPKGTAPAAEKVGIVFERSGFAHWRVVELRLPVAGT